MGDRPEATTARLFVLHAGYVGPRTASTVVYVVDRDRHIVVDPGMVPSQAAILDPLRAAGCEPAQVTDVVLSHHHPDHTINAGLFPNAAVHDHWAIYRGARWEDSEAEGRELGPSVRLIRVPGHSAEDIALVAGTAKGVVVFTHLWSTDTIPEDDPVSPDLSALRASRARVLAFADLIVPGHAGPFAPGPSTPR